VEQHTHYAELMLHASVDDFIKHSRATQPTFFDRGIPEVLSYARLVGLPEDKIRAACDHHRACYRATTTIPSTAC
jgi:predicted ATPase